MTGIVDTKSDYDIAESEYMRLIRGYMFTWSGIVCLYAIILLIVPVIRMLHGEMAANNWVTLFKLAYVLNKLGEKKTRGSYNFNI